VAIFAKVFTFLNKKDLTQFFFGNEFWPFGFFLENAYLVTRFQGGGKGGAHHI
jgi:hypothetical protein